MVAVDGGGEEGGGGPDEGSGDDEGFAGKAVAEPSRKRSDEPVSYTHLLLWGEPGLRSVWVLWAGKGASVVWAG